MTDYARCTCAECQKLDALPVRRHGIPHAWQPNMLSGAMHSYQPWPDDYEAEMAAKMLDRYGNPTGPAPAPWESLPLFAGGLEPELF